MSNLTTEIRVGLFTIVGISVLITTGIILGGNPFTRKKQHFYAVLHNANGIAKRTQVRTSGIEVGSVTSVKIVGSDAQINFDVNNDVEIPKDSVIEIKSRGILGDVYIEIQRNVAEHKMMHSGDKIELNPVSNDLDTLLATMNSIGRDVKKVSGTFASVLGTKKGESSIQAIVDNIEGISSDLRDVTSSQKKNLKETIQALRDSAVRISALIERNDSKVDSIISNIHKLSKQLNKLISDENREQVESIITNINDSSASLKRIMAKIERGEGTIGNLVSKDDTAKEIKATLKDIQNVVKPISELKLTISDRAEMRVANNHDNDSFVNAFALKFATRPDRYYLLGLESSAYARQVQNTKTTTNTNGNITEVNTVQNTPENVGNFRYNVQISQRFNFLAVRFGLFANSGGFATDFYAFHDKLVASVEFSQFDGAPTPSETIYGTRGAFNLKAYLNYYITPNIFVTAGVDGAVIYPSPFPFAGAGLSISDDDIKGLFGVAALAN